MALSPLCSNSNQQPCLLSVVVVLGTHRGTTINVPEFSRTPLVKVVKTFAPFCQLTFLLHISLGIFIFYELQKRVLALEER